MTILEPAGPPTSTRHVDFADGTGSFSIARRAADVVAVQIVNRFGDVLPVSSFDAVDRDDHPGVALVTVKAVVDDGPQSVQTICAE